MKRWYGLAGLCMLAGVAQAQQPVWTHLSDEEGYTLSTGAPTPKDGLTEIELLFAYAQSRPHLDHWHYNSVRQTFQFDCAKNSFRVTRLEMFEDKAGGGKPLARRSFNDELIEIRPETRAATVAKVACAGK